MTEEGCAHPENYSGSPMWDMRFQAEHELERGPRGKSVALLPTDGGPLGSLQQVGGSDKGDKINEMLAPLESS